MIKQENEKSVFWAETLAGELLLFEMLGKILYSIPDRDWLAPLLEQDLFSESPFAGTQQDVVQGLASLAEWQPETLTAEIETELKVDHTYLFGGMSKIPVAPWESVYFTEGHLVFQEQTLNVRNWYRRYGLEPTDKYQEPDDHIGLELAFIAHLARLGLTALQSGDQERFDEVLNAQRGFLDQHLLLWGPMLCTLIIKWAKTDFYKAVALLLRGALTELAAVLEIEIPAYEL